MSVDGLQEYIENSFEQLDEKIDQMHFMTFGLIKIGQTKDDYYNEIYKVTKEYCDLWEKLQELL